MSDIAIHVENLGKRYRIGERHRYKTLRDTLSCALYAPFRVAASLLNGHNGHRSIASERSSSNDLWALKDISFEIKHGEAIGIIGRNGAGKSTLLKILSRITKPTEGYVRMHGRVGSLLEVGTGFHPELTGRENVYLNGAIIGMRKKEIERKFDEIVAFAEIEKFIDTPVKFYSSGMYIRLAFAVAAHLEPEILLVDEVLAVGDMAFQKKCLGKMEDVAHQGRNVIFVSHAMSPIQNLCSRAVLLNGGTICADGPTAPVIRQYLELVQSESVLPLEDRTDREGSGSLRFVNFYALSPSRGVTDIVCTGEDVTLVAEYRTRNGAILKNISVSIPFFNHFGHHMFTCWTRMTGQDYAQVEPSGEFQVHIEKFPLMPGRYNLNLFAKVNDDLADWVRYAATLQVVDGDFFGTGYLTPDPHCGVAIGHRWKYVAHNK
jgi:lipopolysaccharide transport system ATP-binding protein